MSLSALIRKRDTGNLATAIPAISATQPKGAVGIVARIAAVAVASPKEGQITPPAKVGAGDAVTVSRPGEFSDAYKAASRWWLIHYPERDPVEVAWYPEATHAEILERHPDAVAAEPFTPAIRQPAAPMTASEETAIRAWLALIEEIDTVTIAEVISQCQRDADARDYFTGRAAVELPKPDPFPDDRRRCTECLNLRGWVCSAAMPGGLVSANRGYQPMRDVLQRCAGYLPDATDNDQRTGSERWPALI